MKLNLLLSIFLLALLLPGCSKLSANKQTVYDAEDNSTIAINERWLDITVFDKPTSFIYVGEDYSDIDSPYLLQKREDGCWLLWCFLGDDWTIDEVYKVCSIADTDDIEAISIKFKNISSMDERVISDNEIKSEFLSVLNSCVVMSAETWAKDNSLHSKEENDGKAVLYVDILLSSGYSLSLQLYPYADCLFQNGECVFDLGESGGEYLFKLFTGSSTEEFKGSLKKE